MGRSRAVLVFVLVTLCFAAVGEAASRFTCNPSGRVFRFTSDLSPVNLTLMWPKGSSDNDINVFFGDSDDVWALGIGIEDRIEQVSFGALPGVPFEIVAFNAGGPNSKCFLALGAELQALGASNRFGDLGSLDALAARDPRYARIQKRVREIQALKALLR